MRFNANACIAPDGKIYRTCCMGHWGILSELTGYNLAVEDWYTEKNEVMPDPFKWKDDMILHRNWLIISGPEHYTKCLYRVSHSIRPTKASLDSLFNIIVESKDFGDDLTCKQLSEIYQSLINN